MSLVIKVLWKLISLIYFRVYLEVNVHKNPTALAVGVSVRPLGNVLYFNPPLIIDEEEIDEAIKRCVKSIDSYMVSRI